MPRHCLTFRWSRGDCGSRREPSGGGPVVRCVLRWGIAVLAIGLGGTSRAAGPPDPALPPSHSVPPERYATGFAFAEGPALDAQGNLYVANYRELGTIGRIASDGTAAIWCDLRKAAPLEDRIVQANGLKIDNQGRLVVADAGGGRVLRVAADAQQVEVLVDRCDGARFRAINDLAFDRIGNIYFTDPGNSSGENPVGEVFRYDLFTQKTTRLASGLAFPNGIGVTPDQQHLCVAESQRYRILIFPLDVSAGTLGPQRVLIDFPTGDTQSPGEAMAIRGGAFEPDGLVFDEHGRLYVAMFSGGVINVVDVPSGKLLRQYDAGGLQATNCHFHGPYLYTTVAAKEAVFRLQLGVAGHVPLLPPGARP